MVVIIAWCFWIHHSIAIKRQGIITKPMVHVQIYGITLMHVQSVITEVHIKAW